MRCVAKRLCRSSGTFSRELPHIGGSEAHDAGRAHGRSKARRVGSWQRGSNENTNDLLRQHMLESANLSVHLSDKFDEIALSLNTHPRQTLGLRTPLAVYTEHIHRLQLQPASVR